MYGILALSYETQMYLSSFVFGKCVLCDNIFVRFVIDNTKFSGTNDQASNVLFLTLEFVACLLFWYITMYVLSCTAALKSGERRRKHFSRAVVCEPSTTFESIQTKIPMQRGTYTRAAHNINTNARTHAQTNTELALTQ